jgi:hypothetical protein
MLKRGTEGAIARNNLWNSLIYHSTRIFNYFFLLISFLATEDSFRVLEERGTVTYKLKSNTIRPKVVG